MKFEIEKLKKTEEDLIQKNLLAHNKKEKLKHKRKQFKKKCQPKTENLLQTHLHLDSLLRLIHLQGKKSQHCVKEKLVAIHHLQVKALQVKVAFNKVVVQKGELKVVRAEMIPTLTKLNILSFSILRRRFE